MTTQVNEGERRKRLKWFVLPIVVLVPVTVLFGVLRNWVVAGKAGTSSRGVVGLNMQLPEPQLKTKGAPNDKIAYYKQAALDSARMQERRKEDPYSADSLRAQGVPRPDSGVGRSTIAGIRGLGRSATDVQAERVLQQVAEMRRVLASNANGAVAAEGPGKEWQKGGLLRDEGRGAVNFPMPVSRPLASGHSDPQLDQLSGMLDKLIQVQHPDMMRPDSAAAREPALTVTVARDEGESNDGFVEIGGDTPDSGLKEELAIPAIVGTDQVLTTGSTVELRLLRGVVIGGRALLKDQLLYGLATLKGERLEIAVHSLRVGPVILPVNLQVYDLDGLAGIRVPGAIAREVSKESAGEALNGVNVMSVDQSVSAQAATAGLEFARSLAGKKVRLVRVAVPAGYQVLLKNVKR